MWFPSRVGKLLQVMTLWDQGSLCPDLPIVQEKPKIAHPLLFFYGKFFFSFSNCCVAQTKPNCSCRGGYKLPVSNFHSAELTEVGGSPLLTLTMGSPGFFFFFFQENRNSLGVTFFSPQRCKPWFPLKLLTYRWLPSQSPGQRGEQAYRCYST